MSDGKNGPRALIIGGSMAGLFTALLLRKRGWRVDVFERSTDELASRGAGIATHPEMMVALDKTGVGSAGLGVELNGRVTFDSSGAVLGEHDMPQVTTSWDMLYLRLMTGMPAENYHTGVRLDRLVQDGDAVTAIFSDGREERVDLLVGADGVRSTVRNQMLPDISPRYAGYVAWRGMVLVTEASAETRAALTGRISFSLPPGEQFLCYPVAGEGGTIDPDQHRLNWVWYRQASTDPEFEALFTDPDGNRHDVSMPPNRVHPNVVAAMRADAPAALPPQYCELIERTDRPFLQAIYDLESPEMVFGRVAVLGDAAFVARPHTGFGVTKASGDAVALAEAFDATNGDIDAGLKVFRDQRVPFGHKMVERGRLLGRLLDANRQGTIQDPFGAERTTAASVMVETAVSADMV